MAKLVSMKISKAEREARYAEPSVAADAPQYPWGMSINLDSDACKKLGLDVDELKPGQKLGLVATVEVTSLSVNKSQGGGDNQNVSLQITECCIETGDAADAAEALYK